MSRGASNAFTNLMNSNVRPKCEILIKVIDVTGTSEDPVETVLFAWDSSKITYLKFSSEVDQFGRSLPHIELQWKELYYGDLTETMYPEKYQNIFPYLAVDLYFIQDLDFFSSWKTLRDNGETWKSIFDAGKTWKQLKNEASSETIKMPRLFLKSKPLFEKNTVTWIASDCLSFMNDTQTNKYYSVSLMNIVPSFMIRDRQGFSDTNLALLCAYLQSDDNIFNSTQLIGKTMGKELIYTGKTNELLMNFASSVNHYIKFGGDGSFLFHPIGFEYLSDLDFHFRENLLYGLPKTTRGTNISMYIFETSKIVLDLQNKYNVSNYELDPFDQDLALFYFNGLGACLPNDNYNWVLYDWMTYAIGNILDVPQNYRVVTVTPLSISQDTFSINSNLVGDVYEEKNPLNPYDLNNSIIQNRIDSLHEYFNEGFSTFEFSCLPNVNVEPGDVVEVDTLFFDEHGDRKESQCFVCKIEITYNGAIKEKIIAHEVDIGGN